MSVVMPKFKERRGRHGVSKKSPKEKKFSSYADIKHKSGMGRSSSQSKSNGLQDLPASSPLTMQPSSAVSANWKSLAKVRKIICKRRDVYGLMLKLYYGPCIVSWPGPAPPTQSRSGE